jgi:hypothetical protein
MGSAGSEISADAVRFVGDTIEVIAPIAPGEKQLLVEYTIPSSIRRFELEAVTPDTIQVVAEEQDVTVTDSRKQRTRSWTAGPTPAGTAAAHRW